MPNNSRNKEAAQTSIKDFTELQKMEERMTTSITSAISQAQQTTTEAIAKSEKTLKQSIADLRQEVTKELQEIRDDVDEDIADLKKELEKQIENAKREQERHEYHDRKYNLIFSGLQPTKRGEERKTLEAIYELLEIPVPDEIQNFHLLKPSQMYPNEARIIVRYLKWADRQNVFTKIAKLKDSNIRVQTDLPKRLRERRNELLKLRKELVTSGKQARVIERDQDVILQVRGSRNDAWKKYEA